MVGHKDLGNSVRRIMARVFDDTFLIKYSTYGFKGKLPFNKLLMYRVIVGKNIIFYILNNIVSYLDMFWYLS